MIKGGFYKTLYICLFIICITANGCIQQHTPPPWSQTIQAPPEPEYEEGKIKKLASLREEPSSTSKVVKTLPAGMKVKIIEKLDGWYKVLCYDDTEAYVRQSLVQIISPDTTARPILEPVNKPKTRLPNPQSYLTLQDANMRSGPGKEYDPPVTLIKGGQEFITDGYSGKWHHGTSGNKTGWIHASLLNIQPSTNEPRVTSEPIQDSSVPQSQENTPNQAASTEQALNPSANPAPLPIQNKATVPLGKAKISSATPVKVRSQTSQLAKVMGEVAPGEEVTVTENQGSWCKIKTSQITGFIPSNTLSAGDR